MEEEQKELGFSDIMKELGKIMESLQKIMPNQEEPEQETQAETENEPTPAPQPEPEKEDEPTEEEDEKTDVGDADEIDKILKDC